MIIGLFNFEDHCQGKKSQFFSEMCQKGRHSFLTHWSKKSPELLEPITIEQLTTPLQQQLLTFCGDEQFNSKYREMDPWENDTRKHTTSRKLPKHCP